jgi:RNA polymerase sigma factor FliA
MPRHDRDGELSANFTDRGSTNAPAPKNQALRDSLIVDHLELVAIRARRLLRRLRSTVDLDDLVGEGTLGLIHAADLFDSSKGVPFPAWASRRIDGAMLDYLRAGTSETRSNRRFRKAVIAALNVIRATEGSHFTDEQLIPAIRIHLIEEFRSGKRLGYFKFDQLEEKQADDLIRNALYQNTHSSAETTLSIHGEDGESDNRRELADTSTPSAFTETLRGEQAAHLKQALKVLDELESLIIETILKKEKLVEIAKNYGLSQGRISQLKLRALEKLKGNFKNIPEIDWDSIRNTRTGRPRSTEEIIYDTKKYPLTRIHQFILTRFYLDKKNLREISKELKNSVKSIKRSKKTGLKNLKAGLNAAGIIHTGRKQIRAALRFLNRIFPLRERPKIGRRGAAIFPKRMIIDLQDLEPVPFEIEMHPMKPDGQAVLNAYYLKGKTIGEISVETGLQPRAIKRRRHEGLDILKKAGIETQYPKQVASVLYFLNILEKCRHGEAVPANASTIPDIEIKARKTGRKSLRLPVDPDDEGEVPFDTENYRLYPYEQSLLEALYLEGQTLKEYTTDRNTKHRAARNYKNDALCVLREAGILVKDYRQVAGALRYLKSHPATKQTVSIRQARSLKRKANKFFNPVKLLAYSPPILRRYRPASWRPYPEYSAPVLELVWPAA